AWARACRCLARYACGSSWNSASRAAGSDRPGGTSASRTHECSAHSTPSPSRISRISRIRVLLVNVPSGTPPKNFRSGLDGAEELQEEAAVDRLVVVGDVVDGRVVIVGCGSGGGRHGLRRPGAEHGQLAGEGVVPLHVVDHLGDLDGLDHL